MNSTQNYFSEATKNNLSIVRFKPLNKKAVLRKRKERFEGNTLDDEGAFMGFGYRVRSMPETAEFTKKLKRSGILVPDIYESGDDYIIEEFIEGKPISEILPKKPNIKLVDKFLNLVTSAHKKGLVIAERWGKNEILTPKGDIVFIDLDIEYICDFEKELELTEAVNALAVFSQSLEVSRWLKDWLARREISKLYDLPKIIWLLEKHIEFWGDEGDYIRTIIGDRK